MPVSSLPQGETPEADDTLNIEGGVAQWKTEGSVPLTSGQIKDGTDTRWAKGEFRNSDESQSGSDFDPAAHTGKAEFGGHVGPVGEVVTFDPNKNTGKTAG